ncbi:MAG: sensory box histidine kinase/response regulator, partial [Alphaproteobacteria bacterium]|nr:sensory box histidine kinase/response regulator [Alphaproteobacteria bacterium]
MSANLPESFQLIFHDSPLGVAVLIGAKPDSLENALLLYANPSLLRLLQEWRPDRFDLVHLISDLCISDEEESLFPLPTDSSTESAIITKLTLDNSSERWLEIRAQPTTILGEKGYFFWFSDITATKTKELNALNEAKLADAAAQAKSNFLATMSHEIRTPLQTIFGMMELLSEENPTPIQNEMLNAAKNSADGLLEILDDILDLAKVEAGKMELDEFELPLRTLVYGLIEALEAKRRENNIYLKTIIEQDVPYVIHGDPKRLRQIMTNLLGNALKFTDYGGITVRVSCKTVHLALEENKIGLRFEIHDTGIGMSTEVAARLFQPFVQADNSTTRRFGGTGLGLSIAQRLVELMEGKIGVHSTAGEGSVFWFEIPTCA